MRRFIVFASTALFFASYALGRIPPTHAADQPSDLEAEIQEALAGLPAADRRAVEAQRYCPIMQDRRLGSMGAPVKIAVDGQAVFLCCKSCSKKAQANPKATLAAVKKLKKVAAALAKLSDEDRLLAEAQRFCAVEDENLLGLMGKPVKLVFEGQAVFVCCAGCTDSAKADPKKTLAKLKELKQAE